MSDQPELASTLGQQFIEGTPVYDSNGDQVGQVGKHDSESSHLVLHKGLFFPRDVYIPLGAVRSADANAVYLNMSREELMLDRYASPHAFEQPASATTIDRSRPVQVQGGAVIEEQPGTTTQGRAVIEEHPETFTRGTDTIEEHPATFTQGTDTIEPQEPQGSGD